MGGGIYRTKGESGTSEGRRGREERESFQNRLTWCGRIVEGGGKEDSKEKREGGGEKKNFFISKGLEGEEKRKRGRKGVGRRRRRRRRRGRVLEKLPAVGNERGAASCTRSAGEGGGEDEDEAEVAEWNRSRSGATEDQTNVYYTEENGAA